MPVRSASAVWNGSLKDGNGTMKMASGAYEGKYSFGSRFQEDPGTNPEELIAAAHAGCFSMALSAGLGKAGQLQEPDQRLGIADVASGGHRCGFAPWHADQVEMLLVTPQPVLQRQRVVLT